MLIIINGMELCYIMDKYIFLVFWKCNLNLNNLNVIIFLLFILCNEIYNNV